MNLLSILNKLFNFVKSPQPYLENIVGKFVLYNKEKYKTAARNYFEKKNLIQYFSSGEKTEIQPEYLDLKNLHESILIRKPQVVLEFGVGFSTIAMLLALHENSKIGKNGKLYVVDPEKKWIQNTQKKIPDFLKKYVVFNYSLAKVKIFNGQLVSFFDTLPDISPNMILLDGPNPQSVKGSINGLKFSSGRPIVAADILLYESSSPTDLYIIVDGRNRNANFLLKNLKLNYKFSRNVGFKRFTIEKL